MKSRRFLSTLLYLAVLAMLFVWVTGVFTPTGNAVPYSRVLELFRQEQVKQFVVNGDTLTMELYTPYNGSTRAVGAGTVTFTPSGQGHALKNVGKDKLCFIALILKD